MLSREDATELLQGQPNGTYLMRFSKTERDCLAIGGISDDGKIYHSLLKRDNEGRYGATDDAKCPYNNLHEAVCIIILP